MVQATKIGQIAVIVQPTRTTLLADEVAATSCQWVTLPPRHEVLVVEFTDCKPTLDCSIVDEMQQRRLYT